MQNDIYMQDERFAGLPLIIVLFCTLLDIMSLKGHDVEIFLLYGDS